MDSHNILQVIPGISLKSQISHFNDFMKILLAKNAQQAGHSLRSIHSIQRQCIIKKTCISNESIKLSTVTFTCFYFPRSAATHTKEIFVNFFFFKQSKRREREGGGSMKKAKNLIG